MCYNHTKKEGIRMKKNYLVWDWNGTLLNDVDLSIDSINYLLEKEQLPLLETKEAYQRVFQFPIIDYYKAIGFDFDKSSFDKLATEYMNYYQPRSLTCPLHDGVMEALQYYHDQGYTQILLSASNKDYLHQQLAQYPIQHYFQDIISLDNIHAFSKAELAKDYVKQKQAEIKHITFVGDSVHDYEVAKGANANCVLIANGHEHKEKLLHTGCHVINQIQELPELIKR